MKSNIPFTFLIVIVCASFCINCKSAKENKQILSDHVFVDSTFVTDKVNKYAIQFATSPQNLESESEINFVLLPTIIGKPDETVPLETIHEYKIHLILVSNDLSFYKHLHPEITSEGNYSVKTKLKNGGKYVVFADYMPTGSNHQLDRFEIIVGGYELESKLYNSENLTANVDAYAVQLRLAEGKLATNKTNKFTTTITKNGNEIKVNDLENLMAAKGHMVIISKDTKNYIHAHPDVINNRLDFYADFEQPGLYRAFLQFQTDGKIHLADFVLHVVEGTKSKEIDKSHH